MADSAFGENFHVHVYVIQYLVCIQAKIQSLKDRHGNNPDNWPITKALIAAEQSTSQAPPLTPPSLLKAARVEPGPVQNSPKMTLSWTIHSPAGKYIRIAGNF